MMEFYLGFCSRVILGCATDGSGQTPIIIIAVEHHKEAIVELLLINKANVETTDTDHLTPLIIAVQKRNAAIVEVLLLAPEQGKRQCEGPNPAKVCDSRGNE